MTQKNSYIPIEGIIYKENNEIGAKNLSEKLERVKNGGEFEWPNMIALNKAIIYFIKDAKKIVNIGAGTGTFEWYASEDKTKMFIASEFDQECVEWCKKNRERDNIIYTTKTIDELLYEYGEFDLAVSIDVIEHISDYKSFLEKFSLLSKKAIITTPNKDRSLEHAVASPPIYYQHVREWDAGEFYWILKMFYKRVELYAMPDVYVPNVQRIGLLSSITPLIGVCEK